MPVIVERSGRQRERGFAARFLASLGMTGKGAADPGALTRQNESQSLFASPFQCHPERSEGSARLRRARLPKARSEAQTGARDRLVIALVAILALLGTSPIAAQEATLAPDGIHHAGLVIRHGDGRVTYAYVAFSEAEISGIELLRRSGVEQVTIPFGGLGEGVCALEGEGCPASECRRRVCQAPGAESPYWRSFGLDETGAWRPFVLGPSSTRVRDGDVHLWSWTPAEPGLAPVTLTEVARQAGTGEGGPAGSGEAPAAFVRTVYSPGVEPDAEGGAAEPWTYAIAGAILLTIGGGTVYAVRRGRTRGRDDGPDAWEAAA